MKTSRFDATLPPPIPLLRWTMLAFALALLPHVATRGVSAASLGALALWIFCCCIMLGAFMRRSPNQTLAKYEWDNFHFGCGFFLAGLLLIAMLSFPLVSTNGLPPFWWLFLLVPTVFFHLKFVLRTGLREDLGRGCSRYFLGISLPIVCFIADGGALAYINGAYDVSGIRSQSAIVTSKRITESQKSGTAHLIRFRLRDGRRSEKRVSPRVYVRTTPGQTLEVRTKNGLLSAEWIVEVL